MKNGAIAAFTLGGAAAGIALGLVAERLTVGRSLRAGSVHRAEPYGSLHSPSVTLTTSDGATLHVEVDECDDVDAPSVVFTHGYCLNLDCWHHQREALRGQARLVLWDQRGHGRSSRGPGGYGVDTIDRLGSDLATVIDSVCGGGPLILVGHSMGGMTVMALARQRPDLIVDRVRGVTLLGTSAGGLDQVLLGFPAPVARALHRIAPTAVGALARSDRVAGLTRERATDLGLVLTHLYSFGSSVPPEMNTFTAQMLSATPLDVVADFLPAFAAHDAQESLSALSNVDLMVVVGSDDRLTPPEHSRAIVRRLPHGELVILPDTGHMLMLERHREITAVISAQIERVRAMQ